MPWFAAAPAAAGAMGAGGGAALGAGAAGAGAAGAGAAGAGLGAGGTLLPAIGGTAAGAGAGAGGGMLLPAIGEATSAAAPSMMSSLGTGAMSMGETMLPQLATTMVGNATAPRPPGALPSYTTPDMQSRGQGPETASGGGLSKQAALSLLLGDMMEHQQRQQQGYGLRG